ncbi:MAG: hypothetical protein ACTS5V_12550 [Giesbergeria sp.]
MNPFPSPIKPEWDTPRNGDFALYVERLTAAHAVRLPEEPGRVPYLAEVMQRARPVAAIAAAAVPATPRPAVASVELPDLQALKAPLAALLNVAQLGLLVVALVQLVALVLVGLGSPFGVAVAVLAWWVVGRWKRALAAVVKPSVRPTSPRASLSALMSDLQALAEQKCKANKRQ